MPIATGRQPLWPLLASACVLCPILAQGLAEGSGRVIAPSVVTAPEGLLGPEARSNGLPSEEPPEYDERELKAYYDWRNDLFFREFDLHQRGFADFMTARRTYQAWTDEFGTPIVITMANPLFYWVDLDADGEFEPQQGEMWSDPEEDGLNGNERVYGIDEPAPSPPSAPANPVPPSWRDHRAPITWGPAEDRPGAAMEADRDV